MTTPTDTSPQPLWSPTAEQIARQALATPPAPMKDRPIFDRFVDWPLRRTGRAARTSLTGIAVLVAAIRFPSIVNGEWDNFREILWFEAIAIGWLLLATVWVRTITPRHVVSYWILGAFAAGPIVDGVGDILADHVAGNAFQAGVVPVLEEAAKLLPVIFFATLMSRSKRGFGALDLMILGAAVGAGFGIFEDMLWGRSFVSGLDGWGVLFPTILQDPLFVAGHVVWTMTAALGVGLLFLHRRDWWAWFVGPILIGLPVADHAAVNYQGEEFDALRSLLVDGRLMVWVAAAGLLAALVLETQIVARSRGSDHLFAPVPVSQLLTEVPPPPFSSRTSGRQVQRARNDAIYRHHVGRSLRPTAAFEVAATAAARAPAVDGTASKPAQAEAF